MVTSFLVGGLTNGTAYTFTVAAVNSSGKGPASSPSAAVTPHAPTVPGQVRSVTAGAGFEQVSVSWVAPSSDGGAPITRYRLTTSPATQAVTVPGDARSATMTRLNDGTAYRVLVAAVNSAGRGKAGASAGVTPHVTVPGPPVGVTAASVSSGVKVSWRPPLTDGGSAISGYVVTVAGATQKVTVGASARSVTVTGLTSGTSYTFTVAARNTRGKGPGQTSTPAIAGGSRGPKTVVLSAAALAALTEVETDESLVFTSPPSQVNKLTAGDIVVAGVSTATPAGLLAKVTSVSISGSTITVATTVASLDQALKEAEFGTKATLTQGQVAQFVPARPGVALLPRDQAPASAAAGSISLSLNTTLYKSADGRKITVGGSVSVSPSVSFHASITCCVHTASQFTGSIIAAASLAVKAQVSHDISGGYTLGTLYFAPITVDVLGVPVVITPKLTVSLLAKGSVTAGLTAGAGESVTLGAQVTTKDATVSAHPFTSHTTTFTPPTLYGSLTAAAGVGAGLSTKVDDLPGPSVTDSLWLAKLSVNPSRRPWWTLSLQNVLEVDYELSLLHHSFASYQATLSDVTIHLAQATNPYQQITITPTPAVVAPGGQLQLHAQVAGVAAQQVTWSAPTGNGTITSSGLYTAPSTPGTYQVTAVQPASGLKPAAYGLISIQAGDQPPGPPTTPAATSTSYGTATITWKPPADTGGGPITAYTITATPGGNTYPAAGNATSDTIGGLTPGATYTFTITASSNGGTSIPSAPSSPVVIDNVPGGGSTWTATEAPLPSNADTNPYGGLSSVACPSTTSCTAVGGYMRSAGWSGLLVTGSGTSWAATGAGNAGYTLNGVACPSTTSCVAAGSFFSSDYDTQGLLVTGSGTSWTTTYVPQPSNGGGGGGYLGPIACESTSSCVAVGNYTDSSGRGQGWLVTGSGTSWTSTQAPVPVSPADDPGADLESVACPSTTECVAGGQYYFPAPGPVAEDGPLLLAGSGTSWAAAPRDPFAPGFLYLDSVACPSTTSCTAVGSWSGGASSNEPVLLTGSGTSWAQIQVPLPANAASNPDASLRWVACPSTTSCVAVGSYTDSSGKDQGLLLTGSGTTWTAAEAPLPGNTASNPGAYLSAVACPSTISCVAVGGYTDSSSHEQGLLLGGPA